VAWWAGIPGWALAIHGAAMVVLGVFLWTRPLPPEERPGAAGSPQGE
jgi:hypothetical protein